MWFQKELPYPDVDLSSLKPVQEDVYPKELESLLLGGSEQNKSYLLGFLCLEYRRLIRENFKDAPANHNLNKLGEIDAMNHVKRRHLLPTFISKFASHDTNNLTAQVEENYLLKYLQGDSSVLEMKKGIRTLTEVAHFVRCIPQLKTEEANVWTPPPVMLTLRAGQPQDHALLMASMFRSIRYETNQQVQKAFTQEQEQKNIDRAKNYK